MIHLTAVQVRQVAVKADVHPVTLKRYLDGLPVQSTSMQRILRALSTLGYSDAPRPPGEPSILDHLPGKDGGE